MSLLDAASLNNRPLVVPVVCFIVLRSTVPEEQNKHTQNVPPISDSNKKRRFNSKPFPPKQLKKQSVPHTPTTYPDDPNPRLGHPELLPE